MTFRILPVCLIANLPPRSDQLIGGGGGKRAPPVTIVKYLLVSLKNYEVIPACFDENFLFLIVFIKCTLLCIC
jgi:hypothetical protein